MLSREASALAAALYLPLATNKERGNGDAEKKRQTITTRVDCNDFPSVGNKEGRHSGEHVVSCPSNAT